MARRWTVLLGLVALLAAGWLLFTSGVFRRTSETPPRAERPVVPRDLSTGDEPAAASEGGAAGAVPLPEPVDLDAVDRDRDLHGIVVRKADGAPIGGAELQVVSYPWRRASVLHYDGYFESVDGPKTESARDGTFSLSLRLGTEVALLVRADGYAPVELKARQAGERVRVEMQEGVRLTIVTRDEGGKGVAGTRLRLWRTDGDAPTLLGITDDEGRSLIGTLPAPAVYTVDVQPERLGYHSWETVTLSEAGDVEHVVTLVEGRTITGRVIDAETGAAIPDARIGMNWVMVPFTVSDDKGRYALPGWLGKGMNDIHCVADEYGREQWVVEGDVHDFELSRGDRVTGRLLAADGRPVAGAPVSTIGSKHGRDGQGICTRAGRSDAEGRFILKGLRRDMPHTLIVMAEGFGRYLLDFDPNPDRAGTLDLGDLTLPEARTIAGRVLTHEREPVARVEVIVSGNNSDRGRLTGREPDRSMWYGRSESRHTDDLGRFRFGDLSPGSYTIEVRRPGAQGEQRKLRLRDEDLLDVEVVLPGGREFTVTVIDEEGLPVPRVFVSVLDGGGRSGLNGQTDAMGKATFFVAGRATRITAYPDMTGRDLLQADVPVEDDVSEFRLVLKRAATIKGTVLGEDGKPFGNAWISVKTPDNRGAAALSGADGTFSLEVPMGEAFDLVFTGQRGEALTDYVSEPVRAEAGATGVEIRLHRVARDRTLRVKVVFPDGTPVQGVWAFAERSRAETGADGIASFTGLPAGEIGVSATTPPDRKDVIWATPIRVVPAGQDVTLTLRTALPISGVVLMPDGTAAADASVQVRVAEAGLLRVCYRASTDAQGRFSVPIAADEPGPWILHAERKEKGLTGETKDVRTGDADVRIQLK